MNNMISTNDIATTISETIDKDIDIMQGKANSFLHNNDLNNQLIHKEHEIIDGLENVMKLGIDNFALFSKVTIDKAIESTQLPEMMKHELISNVNTVIDSVNLSVDKKLDEVKDKLETFIDNKIPVLEDELATSVSNHGFSKIKDFVNKDGHDLSEKFHNLGEKAGHIFNDYKDQIEIINLVETTGMMFDQPQHLIFN